jgi:hypothetical protein
MRPRPLGLEACTLPDITTDDDLARWLQLTREQLRWLAPATPAVVEHYRYSLQAKQAGGLRLLETPKAELKRVQRHILHTLLGQVPVHEAAHGFTAGRSVKTHAAAHVGQAVVIRFDLRDFFGSVGAAHVNAVWRTLGYPEGVVRSLTTLCTHRTAEWSSSACATTAGLTGWAPSALLPRICRRARRPLRRWPTSVLSILICGLRDWPGCSVRHIRAMPMTWYFQAPNRCAGSFAPARLGCRDRPR